MARNPLDKVVRDIADIRRQLAAPAQVNHASLENRALPVNGPDGKPRLLIGAQDDGTHAVKYVQGPPPPRPTAPVVSVDGPVVRVRWDGMLLGGHIPEDFSRIDVHFAIASEDLEDASAVRGNLATSAGNETVLAATSTGTYRVGLVAMSQSRARSDMSEVVDVEVTLVDIEGALDAVVENARGGSNYYSPEPPSGTDHDPDRDLWFDTSVDAEGLVSYSPHRWDADLQEWVSVADQRTAALQDALGDFEGTVEQRFTDADTAIDGLRDSLTNLDETTLPALRQDLDAAEGRLGEAEGQITDAFGQLEAVPGQISDAQQAAINAAAQDAETKANAAQQAAQEHADLVAQGAEDDAIAAAETRAQELADAAQQAAEQAAQTKADAARDAAIQDAEGKIGVARQEAIDAAIEEMGGIPRPSYGAESPTHDAPDGSVYFQTDDAALVEYAWAGEPHASESIKYIDGEEVARNRIVNGDFENGTSGWSQGDLATAGAETGHNTRMWGGLGGHYFQGRSDTAPRYVSIIQQVGPVPAGAYVGFSAFVATEQGDSSSLRVQLAWYGETVEYNATPWSTASFYSGMWFHQAIPAPHDTDNLRFQVQMDKTAGVGGQRLWVDKVIAVIADTREEALAHSAWYWDGNSPDEVINWQNKVTAQWERRDGEWTQVPIRSEAIANLDVGKLTAGTGEIAELVSRKIAAATGQFLELDVGQLTVTEQTRLADVVAEQIAADTAQFMELEVGKLVASEGILDEAVIKQLFAEVVVSQMSFADEFIGGNAILEGSITAESGIIGSLDLGVAIVGKLHGQYVEAGSIDTEQLAFGAATGDILSVDALNFKRAVGLDLSAPSIRVGDAMELTEDYGIRQFGPDGALNVSLPSDGSEAQFRGDLSAKTLTATGRMSIQGPGAVASGGVLELESGVVPPATPAGVSSYVERTVFPPVGDTYEPVGLAWADGHWWRALDNTILDAPDRIEKISPTGELVDFFEHVFIIHDGITIIGDEIFCLGRPERTAQSRRWVRVYDMAGVQKRQWEYTLYGTGKYQPGIGTDGTNLLIAQCTVDGEAGWYSINPSNGTVRSTTMTGADLKSDFAGVSLLTADFGTPHAVLTTRNRSGAVEVATQSGSFIDFGGWYAGEKQRVVGTAWDGSKWHHMTTDGNLVAMSSTKYPNGTPTTDTDDWWVAVTWTDGTHETPIGPARRYTFMRRTDLRITTGQAPEGVTHARVYAARKTTEPSRTDYHLIGETSANDEQTVVVLPAGWSLRANPPTTNSFAANTPGEIHSALGTFRVDGTGAGEWGPLKFHADGTMTSSAVPDWVPITAFQSGFSPQTWGFAPAYRVWPDGKVEWRGVINGTVNGNIPAFTIPNEAIPPHPVNLPVSASAGSGADALVRVEFGQLDTPSLLVVYRGAVERRWFGLDGVFYYLA